MKDDEGTVETAQPIEPTNAIVLQSKSGMPLPNPQVTRISVPRTVACGQCRQNKVCDLPLI